MVFPSVASGTENKNRFLRYPYLVYTVKQPYFSSKEHFLCKEIDNLSLGEVSSLQIIIIIAEIKIKK